MRVKVCSMTKVGKLGGELPQGLQLTLAQCCFLDLVCSVVGCTLQGPIEGLGKSILRFQQILRRDTFKGRGVSTSVVPPVSHT